MNAASLGILGAAGMVPRPLLAQAGETGHRFLFVFCPGGWDHSYVFAPNFNNTEIDRDLLCGADDVHGIPFVDCEARPAVRSFLESWGPQTCFINGIQVPSVAHEVCNRLILTGQSQPGRPCWASIAAAHGSEQLAAPGIHISGPLFPGPYAESSVRVGTANQLSGLLSGSALASADRPGQALSSEVEVLQEAWLARRIARMQAEDPNGRTGAIATSEALARQRAALMGADQGAVDLGEGADFTSRCEVILTCMENGWSKVGVVAFDNGLATPWDTHVANILQNTYFDDLFSGLDLVMAELAARRGSIGSLLDETTVVVLSEMGRMPTENGADGKEHWTWTAAMLCGAGIRGGQAVGDWTDDLEGLPVDLQTGAADAEGTTLTGAHLGATLLALAGLDAEGYVGDAQPIQAALG
jgi:uncharacterized protein (DUF1501 family)